MASIDPLSDRKEFLHDLLKELQNAHPSVRLAALNGVALEQLHGTGQALEFFVKHLNDQMVTLSIEERLYILNACLPELQGQQAKLEKKIEPKPSKFWKILSGIGRGAKYVSKFIIDGLTTKNFWLGLTYSTTLVAVNNYFLSASLAPVTIGLTAASVVILGVPMYRKALKAYKKEMLKAIGNTTPEKRERLLAHLFHYGVPFLSLFILPGSTLAIYAADTLQKLHKGYLVACILMPTGVLIIESWCVSLPHIVNSLFSKNKNYIGNVSDLLRDDLSSLEISRNSHLMQMFQIFDEPFQSALIKSITDLIKKLAFHMKIYISQAENNVIIYKLLEGRLRKVRSEVEKLTPQGHNPRVLDEINRLEMLEVELLSKIDRLDGCEYRYQQAKREEMRLKKDVEDLIHQLNLLKRKLALPLKAHIYEYEQDISQALQGTARLEVPILKVLNPVQVDLSKSIIFDPDKFLSPIRELQKQKVILTLYHQLHTLLEGLKYQGLELQSLEHNSPASVPGEHKRIDESLMEVGSIEINVSLLLNNERKERDERKIIANQLQSCRMAERRIEEQLQMIMDIMEVTPHLRFREREGYSASFLSGSHSAMVPSSIPLVASARGNPNMSSRVANLSDSSSSFPLVSFSASSSATASSSASFTSNKHLGSGPLKTNKTSKGVPSF